MSGSSSEDTTHPRNLYRDKNFAETNQYDNKDIQNFKKNINEGNTYSGLKGAKRQGESRISDVVPQQEDHSIKDSKEGLGHSNFVTGGHQQRGNA